MKREHFATGLHHIANVSGAKLDEDITTTYYIALRDLTDEEWRVAVVRYIRTMSAETYGRLPMPAVLIELARPVAAYETTAEATTVFEKVRAANDYTPEAGGVWSYRGVKERCGDEAAQAFLAAGGPSAFAYASASDLVWLRKRFVDAYVEAKREERVKQLTQGKGGARALPEGGSV